MPFAQHQTFHIREGWLFKGMAAIKEAEAHDELPTIFTDKDAPERLGIGRNMVIALRFWMQATGLTEEQKENHFTIQRLTPLGELIWKHDQYLESDVTLWMIHYQLVCSKGLATTWYWFFNHYAPTIFDETSVLDALSQWVITTQHDKSVAKSSLEKDIECLLKTYLLGEKSRTPEQLIDSPMARLGLIQNVSEDSRTLYRLLQADRTRINPLVLLYVLVDQQKRERQITREVKLSQILREPMNVGRVFNLNTTTLNDLLIELKTNHPELSIQFIRTAGLDQLYLPDIEPIEILKRCYSEENLSKEVVGVN